MSSVQWVPGLYLIRQYSRQKGVYHFGILDVGNQFGYPMVSEPIVFHQVHPRIRADLLSATGEWESLGRVCDTGAAMERLRQAIATPCYDFVFNNCEHFARYVATGNRESVQVRDAATAIGAAALLFLAVRHRAA